MLSCIFVFLLEVSPTNLDSDLCLWRMPSKIAPQLAHLCVYFYNLWVQCLLTLGQKVSESREVDLSSHVKLIPIGSEDLLWLLIYLYSNHQKDYFLLPTNIILDVSCQIHSQVGAVFPGMQFTMSRLIFLWPATELRARVWWNFTKHLS